MEEIYGKHARVNTSTDRKWNKKKRKLYDWQKLIHSETRGVTNNSSKDLGRKGRTLLKLAKILFLLDSYSRFLKSLFLQNQQYEE